MTPERWQRVKEIFNSALQHEPLQRSVFLSDACGTDESLRREVETLIATHEKDGSFIDSPAYQVAAELLKDQELELKPGEVIASYEIVSYISRGGMGEVYLAQDQRLNRRVALKLLPAAFTKDNDRLRRFEQEARAASALNHPNIITIHEIQKVNSTHLIVTEFVEGETLRQRLARTPLNLAEALQVAIQIADALTAAHKAGIIHRDIKPENIMLRPDGYVKVLDFGLAKLVENSPSVLAAEAPTRDIKTGSGIVIGTAGYMSPEQARGLVVDERSDIFSVGAVVYEMVAHRKPFGGETPSDVLAAILKTEPPPLSHLKPEAPAELVRIVTKALRKDREERYQVVKDLLIDLRSLLQELQFQEKLEQSVVPEKTGEASVSTSEYPDNTRQSARLTTIAESLSIEIKRPKIWALVALISIVLVTLVGFGLYRQLIREPHSQPFQMMSITRLTNSGKAIDATISPDGKYIVYALSDAGKQSLWIRQVSTANDTQILPPANVGFFGLTISPDGNDLYYAVKAHLDQGALYRIPILGGTPVKLLERIDGPVSFAPDGKRLVFVRGNYPNPGESALVIAGTDGTAEQTLAVRKAPEKFVPIFFTGPAWSPDGKLIAATVANVTSGSHVVAFNIDDSREEVLTREDWPFIGRVQWLPDGSGVLVVAADNPSFSQIWFVSYPAGEKRRITNDLNGYRAIGLTADGDRICTIQVSGLVNIWVAPDGDAKRAVQLSTGNVGFYGASGHGVAWTPEGRIVFISNESGNSDIWIMDSDGANRKQLTANKGQNVSPVVSADGRYIVFASDRAGARSIWRMNIDGSDAKRLTSGLGDFLPSVSPDGKWVLYSSTGPTHPTVWKVPIDGGDAVELTDGVGSAPVVSPDGKLVAYVYPDSPDPFAPPNRIAVIPFEGGAPLKTFSFQESGTITMLPQWSVDGSSILYPVSNNNVTNLWSQSLDGGPPKQVTDFKDSLMTGFAWSRDGKQLACKRGILLRDAVLISDTR
ncbi:MAG TPA: protein kinase [Pyrinomonadaceae bacterium]|nr:protein kinase [Pyrinomonadaceae bacterium]